MTDFMTVSGPFETERQVIESLSPWPVNRSQERAVNAQIMQHALVQTGVEPGAFGMRIVDWLTYSSPQTTIVIADIIMRAHNNKGV